MNFQVRMTNITTCGKIGLNIMLFWYLLWYMPF